MSAQESKYEEYYQIVNSAKNNYSKGDFKEANQKIKRAFSKTEFPHGHYLRYALISTIKSKDNY
jgi:hypothetical protein